MRFQQMTIAAALASLTFISFALPGYPAGAEDGSGNAGATSAPRSGYALAKADAASGRYAEAILTLEALVAAEPGNADAWNLLAYSNRKLRRYDAAAGYYEKALALNPEHLGALEYQGELFLATQQIDRAKANLALLKKLCGTCGEYTDLKSALTGAGYPEESGGAKRLKVQP